MMKTVYVASPLAGDISGNMENARQYCRFVYEQGYIPLAPHLLMPQFLDETNPEERQAGMKMGLELLRKCDQLWVFGDVVSAGMKEEMQRADELGIPVIYTEMPEENTMTMRM